MKNNKNTLDKAWLEYQQQLLRYVVAKVTTLQDAEDIVSDVFIKLNKNILTKGVPSNLSAWIYRVTKNTIIDYYRTQKTHDELPNDIESIVEEKDAIAQLSNCMAPMIKALPSTYQQVMTLSEIEGLSNKEVAQHLNMSLSAIKSRILRGKDKLHASVIACCTLEKNFKGDIVDFEQKPQNNCNNC